MSKVFTITEGLENMGALRTGGQGSVYKGRRTGYITSAVKILPTPIHKESDEDRNYRSFLNEVEKLKKVNEIPNPNIVKILSSGITESGSLPYIEMEFIEGPDLEELLKPPHEHIFTIKEVIKLADQLANALAHCHLYGVKHGDIKSNNVKYNVHSGNYVLLDFGLAIMSDEQRRTSIRHAGAIEFMAPEQNTGAMLFQTDIYSFGIILYELLAGRVPFPLADSGETSRNEVMVAHMEKPLPDMMELRKAHLPKSWTAEKREQEMKVPDWLSQLITACLEKDPEKRYKNGMALQEALVLYSVEGSRPDVTFQSLELLKAQNDALQQQLLSYQQAEGDTEKAVRIRRPVFAAIIAILIGLATLGSYRVLKSHRFSSLKKYISPTKPVSSIKPENTQTPVIKSKNAQLLPSTDSIEKNSKAGGRNDSILSASKKPLVASNLPKKKIRKKRKKFLGIF